MPQIKQPKKLADICVDRVYSSLDKYWLREGGQIKKVIDEFEGKKYFLGPFESLNDHVVQQLLERLYGKQLLNKYHLYLFLHNRLKRIDFSFLRKHKSILNPNICSFIGNNCYNIIELNLFAQTELTPNSLCSLIQEMKHLKRLNLSHTKTNGFVAGVLSKTCKKLEHLNLDNCQSMFDDDVDSLCQQLKTTLVYLNIDNIDVSKKTVVKILLDCTSLRFLYASHLFSAIQELYMWAIRDILPEKSEKLATVCHKTGKNRSEQENEPLKEIEFSGPLNLDTIYIDNVVLKSDLMDSLSYLCPKLKILQINCLGSDSYFSYLNNFSSLSELVLINPDSLLCYHFNGHLMNALKDSIGSKLKLLHLDHIVDVNLRSIAKYCRNLVKLNVEFICYYEPANDPNLTQSDLDAEVIDANIGINSLRFLAISNTNNKYEQVHLNMGQFKKDLKLLLSNAQVKFLHLSGLNELEDEYLNCMFTTRAPRLITQQFEFVFIHESVEIMELRQMNQVTAQLVIELLIKARNSLKQLNLVDCKLISKADFKKMEHLIKYLNLDLRINWS